MPTKGQRHPSADKIYELYSSGISYNQLAERFRLSKGQVGGIIYRERMRREAHMVHCRRHTYIPGPA